MKRQITIIECDLCGTQIDGPLDQLCYVTEIEYYVPNMGEVSADDICDACAGSIISAIELRKLAKGKP